MNGQLRIERMYAFVMVDPVDNTEGVPAFYGPSGVAMPMVGADMAMIDKLRPLAEEMVAMHPGSKITLCLFENRTEVETFE